MKQLHTFFILIIFLTDTFSQVTIVPSPNPSTSFNIIRGISGTTITNIWAVGTYDETGNYNFKNLMLKWNGTSWIQVNTPNPESNPDLYAVYTFSDNSAWAVGQYAGIGSLAQMQILRWNGSHWSLTERPETPNGSYLSDIDAISENNIWAAGGGGIDFSNGPSMQLIMKWNGSSWSRMYVPAAGARRNKFTALDVISADNIWAVGSWGDVLGQYRFLIQHWDGNSWTHVQSPITNQSGELSDILAISQNDIWTIGGYTTGGAVYMHWNGSNWSIVPSPGSTGDMVAFSSNNIYSVGSNVARWDGSAWTIVDNLSQLYGPALGSATMLSNGDIWAGGRYLNNEDELVTLTVKIQDGNFTGLSNNETIPYNYQLYQNFPNPFNPNTTIKFYIPAGTNEVQLNVYNSLGQLVQTLINDKVSSGEHTVKWYSDDAAGGVYFYKLIFDGNTIDTKKMILIK